MTEPGTESAGGGPKVVVIGGGHGVAASLRAARTYTDSLVAVVSIADDGGSSGRLRQALGLPPPGDLRRCLSALAAPESPWAAALEHRFESGDLEGHALGNLMIAGLHEATGSLQHAVDEVARLAGVVGRVMPATMDAVTLEATLGPGAVVRGQVAVSAASGIEKVQVDPPDPAVPQAVLAAISAADQIVIGPGSLYTSVLAALAVPAVRDSVAAASGQVVYVVNLAPQHPETAGYTLVDHCRAVVAHGVRPDLVLADVRYAAEVEAEADALDHLGMRTSVASVTGDNPRVHEPNRLGRALQSLLATGEVGADLVR